MARFCQVIAAVFMYLCAWLKECLERFQRRLGFNSRLNWTQFSHADTDPTKHKPENQQSDVWRTHQDYRTYRHQSNGPMVMVKTSTHTFHVSIYTCWDCFNLWSGKTQTLGSINLIWAALIHDWVKYGCCSPTFGFVHNLPNHGLKQTHTSIHKSVWLTILHTQTSTLKHAVLFLTHAG